MQVVVVLLLVLAGAFFLGADALHAPIEQPPGVLVEAAPEQQQVSMRSFARGDYTIVPEARYAIDARVLGVSRYRFDRESDLAPWDLAVGWGRMSDSAVLGQLDITQRDRFFFWRADTMPIPRRELESSAANMHLIPATDAIGDTIAGLRPGQVVRLEGLLVNAVAGDGWRWRTSLSRHDTGGGACELMYVESVTLL